MKKFILFSIIFFLALTVNAQFTNQFIAGDSSLRNIGNYSGLTLRTEKDSIKVSMQSYIRFFHNEFRVRRTSSIFNDGKPTSIIWSTSDGQFRRSPLDSLRKGLFTGNANQYVKGNGDYAVLPTGDYYNTVNVAGGAGQAVFYLTSDKTSGGTALYTTIDAVIPIINDATQNYTYGWSYNAGTKALTVTAKTNLTAVISLLTVVLGPTNVANGVPVQVVVKGH